MHVDVEYEVHTLAELIEACQSIHNETGGTVDPSEIYIESKEFNRIWLHLAANQLSDGSTVYNVEVR